jgi:class 3 adenylate cyclase
LATERVERKLAAILAADVAGYSRLMGTDEEGTLARLKALRRELADPKIKEHRGRIVKTTGDGLLLEFASVVDAVRCAVDSCVGSLFAPTFRLAGNRPEATLKDWSCHAGPMVRILVPFKAVIGWSAL